ncbi:hypothetical protein C8J57DRAFT_1509946 [Mycena rebaudengoi]|nr:hypothetical protein C8J57DRAFT_1509946 [Mycena rebaudengoi]
MLFDFDLQHTPGSTHAPDGLSRRPKGPDDPVDEEDPEDWIDRACGFSMVAINWDQTLIQHISTRNDPDSHLTSNPYASMLENSYASYGGTVSAYTVSVFSVTLTNEAETIPRQPKAVKVDKLLDDIRGFFNNTVHPEDMEDHDYSDPQFGDQIAHSQSILEEGD